jgi:hypothetical protein
MFRSYDNLQGATLFLVKVTYLKTLTDEFPYINLVLWQHVCNIKYIYYVDYYYIILTI